MVFDDERSVVSSTVVSDTDEEVFQGVLWKMKQSLLGGTQWKKRWVYIDSQKLLQWQSPLPPDNSTVPSKSLPLRLCTIKEGSTRPFSFTLAYSDDRLTLAADNELDYQRCNSILNKYCNIGYSGKTPSGKSQNRLSTIPEQENVPLEKNSKDTDNDVDKSNPNSLTQSLNSYSGPLRLKIDEFWTPIWGYIDREKFSYWFGESIPNAKLLPVNTLSLSLWIIDDTNPRKSRFSLHSSRSKSVFQFEAPTPHLYRTWLAFFAQASHTLNEDSDDDEKRVDDQDKLGTSVQDSTAFQKDSRLTSIMRGFSNDTKNSNEILYVEGPIWKGKVSFLTGAIRWKRKWFYLDQQKFLQWDQEFRPQSNYLQSVDHPRNQSEGVEIDHGVSKTTEGSTSSPNDSPSCGFPLSVTEVDILHDKKLSHAFSLWDKKSGVKLYYAVPYIQDLISIVEIFSKGCPQVSSQLLEKIQMNKEITTPPSPLPTARNLSKYEIKPLVEDLFFDHFQRNNLTKVSVLGSKERIFVVLGKIC